MELCDILDKDGRKTGRLTVRGTDRGDDEYQLVVFVWIKNSDGKFLISKRSKEKSQKNKWETVGGSVMAGEESIEAAMREVKEELGITLDEKSGTLLKRVRFDTHNPWFADIWLFYKEFNIQEVKLQKEEVSDAKIVEGEEILKLIKEDKFYYGDMHLQYVGEKLYINNEIVL